MKVKLYKIICSILIFVAYGCGTTTPEEDRSLSSLMDEERLEFCKETIDPVKEFIGSQLLKSCLVSSFRNVNLKESYICDNTVVGECKNPLSKDDWRVCNVGEQRQVCNEHLGDEMGLKFGLPPKNYSYSVTKRLSKISAVDVLESGYFWPWVSYESCSSKMQLCPYSKERVSDCYSKLLNLSKRLDCNSQYDMFSYFRMLDENDVRILIKFPGLSSCSRVLSSCRIYSR